MEWNVQLSTLRPMCITFSLNIMVTGFCLSVSSPSGEQINVESDLKCCVVTWLLSWIFFSPQGINKVIYIFMHLSIRCILKSVDGVVSNRLSITEEELSRAQSSLEANEPIWSMMLSAGLAPHPPSPPPAWISGLNVPAGSCSQITALVKPDNQTQ